MFEVKKGPSFVFFPLYLTRPVSIGSVYASLKFKIYKRMAEFYFKVSQVGAEDCDFKTASLF